ncbi:LicD family protein [Secundilactobacillus yichangensis]|uniref:LicD family protein n=1 Tax=Secundilactobacillus yichangensis TaxID=2799580 RepID=UPI0019421308|nr:LicD family protein [Secundilactobacillus yichangensis]
MDLVERLHHVELGNLAKIISLCDELSLDYFLIGGSLLGAIRHQGFIPWDDDMDIGMTRADYETFAKYAPEKLRGDHYFLQTAYSDDSYGFSYMKLLDRFTYIEEKGNVNNARKGVFIDIFPFDRIPDDPSLRRSQITRFKFLDSRIIVKAGYGLIDTPLRRHRSDPAPEKVEDLIELKKQRENVMRLYEFDHSNFYKNLASQYSYDREILSGTEISNLTKVPFEYLQVNVPTAYDAILTRMYGDYMTLPPESQRTEKHISRLIMDNQVFY